MSWQKQKSARPIVTLGDEHDQKDGRDVRRSVEGLLVGVREVTGFHNPLLDIDTTSGEQITVPQSAALKGLEQEVGRRVRLTFKGVRPLKGGKSYRAIDVELWDEDNVEDAPF